jgi:hypothetical protein
MNRRKAIGSIVAVGLTGVGVYSWTEYRSWYKNPDYQYLENARPTLSALAETIIPTSDTPGAAGCDVDKFIVVMIRDCAEIRDANTFIDGLKKLAQYSYDMAGKKYEDCTTREQVIILRHFEEKGKPMGGLWGKVQKRYLGRSFFSILKDYTVQGFCTSQKGASQSLAYVPVPTAYHGCIPLQPGQHGWATR